MHSTILIIGALAATVLATPTPQGVTAVIPPPSAAPEGCKASYDGEFEIAAVSITEKRDLNKRSCHAPGSLTVKLANGVLTDASGRTGYIADNYQFQFDGPAQTGAIYTGGFSVCGNGSLALGDSLVFYQCLSGSFYNLYDRSWAAQCEPVIIDTLGCGNGPAPVVAMISELPDGQPQVPTGIVTQIPDGQIQNPTAGPHPSSKPVTQIPDGQIQAPTGTPSAPITQIPDGQVQAPTGKPSATGNPITQISDGQVQAPTGKPSAPITQIPDGQIQAPTGKPSPTPITQIPDGQIQAPTGTGNTSVTTPPAPLQTPNSASFVGPSLAFALASVMAVFLL